jgi:sec-independent protein translocase protein TatA
MFEGLASSVHLIIILLIILLLFGAKRLPEMGRSLGQGIQEFKEGLGNKDASRERHTTEAVEERGKACTKRNLSGGCRGYHEFRTRWVVSFEGSLVVSEG